MKQCLPVPPLLIRFVTDQSIRALRTVKFIIFQPLLRIDCDKEIQWKEDRLDVDRNRAFFELLKSNSRFGKQVQIEGTHMLTLTNPTGVAKELIDFIPKAELC